MDWNGNNNRVLPYLTRSDPTSFSFLFNYDHHYPPQGGATEMMKHPMMMTQTQHGGVAAGAMTMDHHHNESSRSNNKYGNMNNNIVDPKKKRMTSEQLDSLESSFQEEIKLDPDRKLKLAQELGLQPRQVAVWFQNRRARWKAKQLELLYLSLKHQLDLVSREKHKLQEEVVALRAILKEGATKKQVSGGYTDISGEDTVESTSAVGIQSSNNKGGGKLTIMSNDQNQNQNNTQSDANGDQCNYIFNVGDYNNSSYWGGAGGVMTPYP